MKNFDRLLKAAEPIWESYHSHPFVKGIADGTLDKEKFRFYIVQDYLYLIEYAKVFGLGVAKASTLELMKLFSGTIHLLTDEEMDIHNGYMGLFNLTNEELANTKPSMDNLAYTSYMLRVAYEETEVEILAAILSCAYSYEVIAKRMYAENPDCINHPFYGNWIKGYCSEEFSASARTLMDAFERLSAHYTEEQLQHVEDIFVVASRHEYNFWDMSWHMKM